MQAITPADWSYTEYANLPGQISDDAAGIEQAARQFVSCQTFGSKIHQRFQWVIKWLAK